MVVNGRLNKSFLEVSTVGVVTWTPTPRILHSGRSIWQTPKGRSPGERPSFLFKKEAASVLSGKEAGLFPAEQNLGVCSVELRGQRILEAGVKTTTTKKHTPLYLRDTVIVA